MLYRKGNAVWLSLNCKLVQRYAHNLSAKRIPLTQPITKDEYFKIASTSPKLFALNARLQLGPNVTGSILAQVMLDKTAFPDLKAEEHNENLAIVGDTLLKAISTEYMVCRWPRLPVSVISSAQESLYGKTALIELATLWGIEIGGLPDQIHCGKLCFRRVQKSKLKKDDSEEYLENAVPRMVKALIGAIYLRSGLEPARTFIHTQVLDRELDLEAMVGFTQAHSIMKRLSKREKWGNPVVRLLAESGRKSHLPAYLAGVYINNELVGQGEDTSFQRAYKRAMSNSLKSYLLYDEPDFCLPSETVSPTPNNQVKFKPNYIDNGDIIC